MIAKRTPKPENRPQFVVVVAADIHIGQGLASASAVLNASETPLTTELSVIYTISSELSVSSD